MCHHSNSQEREARVQSLDSVQSEVNLLFFKPIIKDRLACNLLFLIPINRSLYNSVFLQLQNNVNYHQKNKNYK